MEGANESFKVVIVGAGVAGLAISHALQKVNIHHVVLEKGVVAPHWGASITIWAHGARILQQLGCLDALKSHAEPMKMMFCRDKNGRAFSSDVFFDMMTERLGYETLTFERRNFLQILYDCLPDKSPIRTGRRVTDIVEDSKGVVVQLADGSNVRGDLVIGCDGVHSICREIMWRNANANGNGTPLISASEKRSFATTYKALIGVAKTIPGLGERDMTWVHNKRFSWLILTQPDYTYFFVHWKLPEQVRWPNRLRWSEQEVEEAAKSVADHPVSETLVFGEVWKNRIRGHLISLEEGVFDHWYHGRLVLVGDAVHKVTPNFALGANCALESVVVLLNKIVSTHSNIQCDKRPTTADFEVSFEQYQEARKPRMKEAFDASFMMTRLQAYDGLLNHFTMRVLVPLLGQSTFADKLAELVSGAPKFDFLPPVQYSRRSTYAWKDEMITETEDVESCKKTWSPQGEQKMWNGPLILQAVCLVVLLWIFLAVSF